MMGAFAEHMKMARSSWAIWSHLYVRGGRIYRAPNGRWVLDVTGGSSQHTKAFSVASADTTTLKVTVRGGPVVGFSGKVDVAETEVNVGGTEANPHYVYVQGTISPLTAATQTVSTATFPVHDAQYWRKPLFKVYVNDNGTITIPAGGVYHDGVIDLKTWYGP